MQSENQEANDELAQAEPDEASGAEFDQALEEVANAPQKAPDSLEARLAEADREVLRAKAEMENFRKRLQRESEQQLKYAIVPLARDLVGVIDNLQRAISAASDDGSVQALREGVAMVNEQLLSVLAKYACQPIEALGTTFDPNIHEAIAQAPSEEHDQGQVMQEVATGYLLHDRVVRPSSVIVSSGRLQSSEDAASQ